MYSRSLFLPIFSSTSAEKRQSRRPLDDLLAVTVRLSPQEEPLLVIEAKETALVMTRHHVRTFAEHLRQGIAFLAQCVAPSSGPVLTDLSLEEDMARVDAEVRDLSARICFQPLARSSAFPGYLHVASLVTPLTYTQAQLVEADVDCLVQDLDTAEATYFYARGSFEGEVHVQRREHRGRTAPVLCGSPVPQSPIVACLRPGWFVTPCRGDPGTETEAVVCSACLVHL